jgi:hypothetical protein
MHVRSVPTIIRLGFSPGRVEGNVRCKTLACRDRIRYRRGIVTILDRRGLKQRSCECYGVSKKEFDRLLGDRALPKVCAGKM